MSRTQPQGDPGAAPRDEHNALIESIYRIALEPLAYDAFMSHWESHISGRIDMLTSRAERDSAAQAPPDQDLAPHFEIASKLLAQSPPPASEDANHGATGEPRMLVDGAGRIVWSNATADRLFKLPRTATIDRLDLPAPQNAALRDHVARLALPWTHDAGVAPALVLRIGAPGGSRPVDMAARRIDSANGPVLALTPLTPRWHGAMDTLLRDGFALSPSEIKVSELAAEGLSPAEIAERRDAALGTVRTQIKSILAKTRCAGQADLVRLLHTLLRLAEEQGPERAPLPGLRTIRLRDREMPVEEHGDRNGRAVVFLHGMLDGTGITHRAHALLQRAGLRLVCPVRPCFGTAAPSPGPKETAPQRLAEDVLLLIERLKLERPVLVGHMAGSVYAFAAAAAAPPGTVRGVVSVAGGVPILSPRQFAQMSARQRLVAYTARYAPEALPFVVRAGISQIRGGGERRFLHSLYESSPCDMRLTGDPEIAGLVLDGYRFTIAQGHAAFEIDSHQVVQDWSALVEGSDVPVHLVHGAEDPVVSVASVRAFRDRYPHRARLTVLEEAGQLVLHQSPEAVVAAIESLFA